MIKIVRPQVQKLIVRGSGKVEVLTKPHANTVRVVQSSSPVPGNGGSAPSAIDGGNF